MSRVVDAPYLVSKASFKSCCRVGKRRDVSPNLLRVGIVRLKFDVLGLACKTAGRWVEWLFGLQCFGQKTGYESNKMAHLRELLERLQVCQRIGAGEGADGTVLENLARQAIPCKACIAIQSPGKRRLPNKRKSAGHRHRPRHPGAQGAPISASGQAPRRGR